MTYLTRVEAALEQIAHEHRLRTISGDPPRYAADFSTNDYLALAADSRMVEAMRRIPRVGSGGARLLGGRSREHFLLEEDLARWRHRERALIFSSGYMAALGVIPALAQFVNVVYSDALNHASLIDGVRSSRAEREIYPHAHLPPRSRRAASSLIITESLFGMDGDTIDVPAIVADLGENDILLLDEAHAAGVLGHQGAGLACELDDPRIVITGSLGKAVGTAGGFIAGPARLVELLVNTARTFIFDTAPPPAIAFAARVGVLLATGADDRRARLRSRIERLRSGLSTLGFAVPQSQTPIVPVIFGQEVRTMRAMECCLERGVYAPAIRPPTVPQGASRLRISLRCDHTDEQIDLLLESLACTVTL
ncbi:MAG TPA: aminotransferase class I/II-fold pyridoxal phosphate-dependent enzyme [Candidatus Baltobacteraceae bacterium]|jgi:8-amino-7-oxononanoate synthase|nr:aminotransferase class I/II-fold pyridoxal phosphate-dependent enzyme [Candidatus Baltobacteraceae bacterium]